MSTFSEFCRISEAHRSSKSVGGYTRHGNSVSDFLFCNLRLDESKLSFSRSPPPPLSLSLSLPNHPPKMHYRISQWLRSFDAWMLEARRARVVRRDEATRGRGHAQESSQRVRSLLQHGVILHSFAILSPFLSSFRLSLFFPPFEPLISPTNYSQRSVSIARNNWNKN